MAEPVGSGPCARKTTPASPTGITPSSGSYTGAPSGPEVTLYTLFDTSSGAPASSAVTCTGVVQVLDTIAAKQPGALSAGTSGGTAAKEQPIDPVRRPRCYRPVHIRRSRSRCPKSTLRSPRRCSCRARYADRESNGALHTQPAPALPRRSPGHRASARDLASWRCTRPDRPLEEHSLPRGGMTTFRFPSRKDDDLRLGMASLVTTATPELATGVVAPAQHAAIAAQGTRRGIADGDGDDGRACGKRDARRRIDALLGDEPELAARIHAAPAVHVARRGSRARMLVGSGDVDHGDRSGNATGVGVTSSRQSPLPSWPLPPRPQQESSPVPVRAHA